jgi:hypothetical protein
MQARSLRHVRQSVAVIINDGRIRTIEEVQPFARAIRGHPSITSIRDSCISSYESLENLYSALATLPALESGQLSAPPEEDESTLAYPESLTELLRVPPLRSVRFDHFSFTPALFQATVNVLLECMAVTKLEFI